MFTGQFGPVRLQVSSTHKVATTKLMQAKTSKTLNSPRPSTPFSKTLLRSSNKPDDRTALPSADPDMAIKTIDHWKEWKSCCGVRSERC